MYAERASLTTSTTTYLIIEETDSGIVWAPRDRWDQIKSHFGEVPS